MGLQSNHTQRLSVSAHHQQQGMVTILLLSLILSMALFMVQSQVTRLQWQLQSAAGLIHQQQRAWLVDGVQTCMKASWPREAYDDFSETKRTQPQTDVFDNANLQIIDVCQTWLVQSSQTHQAQAETNRH
ncbi:MAG: hypothetical protein ACPHV3_06415 [Vibrio sp.]